MKSFLVLVVLCLILVNLARPIQGQWSQSLGWGGAGGGKRSQGVLNKCQEHSLALREMVSKLIELEAVRLIRCQGESASQDKAR